MIVDASAILAMLLKEPEVLAFADHIGGCAEEAVISPVNYLEIALRIDRGETPELSAALDPLLASLEMRIAAITPEQAYLAREAYQRFGKGNHPARLNQGDCFAYALAKSRGEALLFKGDDFRQTDVEAAF
ncbi:type II toxin-antitoxin system VapC family toxin [Aquibium sp. ELW1220]|uniref:type II toxin-antitoxin system VapC family toxin n=1 Tax=Aquibium sp. ELW1220 TaxID=2976766 RepID=UPI0025B253EA|nr:type II toxin-antitoxin system VapC family toxin [Aquibium sp. ELW1220]MDN2578878.1 type II toxin-antitoxin system VapC family toxin [Aquibium sp. ELW1220]